MNPIQARIVRGALKLLLSLRYRIHVGGLEAVRKKGRSKILFLPNHPAFVDPIIVATYLHGTFGVRPVADAEQIERPVIRSLFTHIGGISLPSVTALGFQGKEGVEAALESVVSGLRNGDNVLLYPSGHLMRSRWSTLGANSAVEYILQAVPDVRVVLIKTRGLWGSSFGWGGGSDPNLRRVLRQALRTLLLNGLFFTPRRTVELTAMEAEDLPSHVDRRALNRYIEEFYNQDAPPAWYVPYRFWERGGGRELPEPEWQLGTGDLDAVPASTRDLVIRKLREVSGVEDVAEHQHLANDLGLDSLSRAEILLWIQQEFGMPPGDTDALQRVSDVMLAASGQAIAAFRRGLKPVPRAWFRKIGEKRLDVAPGATIPEAFFRVVRDSGRKVLLADQVRGLLTRRKALAGAFILATQIRALPGSRIGIMLPASAGATVVYLATLLAGKTPVMINWTVGTRSLRHCLQLSEVETILTARLLRERLDLLGIDLSEFDTLFVHLEDVGSQIGLVQKLLGFARTFRPGRPAGLHPDSIAVVLFTSGSESLPKAVPLTHRNILTNLRDVAANLAIFETDRMIGMLPPFHSFGIVGTVILPLVSGLPVVYHPNPTEARVLGALIEAYKVTILVGTPTFLGGIVRAATSPQLATLRRAFTGAEKCPVSVYEAMQERCPKLIVIEGYGITECSPVVSFNDEKNPRPYTIGKVVPSLRHAIVDLDRNERVETGEQGMLLVRGPSIFPGYLNHEGTSPFVEFEEERWYRTGDLVTEDDDGVLTFSGRLKRFIKLGGEMVSLPAVESVLEAHFPLPDEDGPSIAVEALGDETSPEIVLFTRVPTNRESVNAMIRDGGLSPLHNVRRVVDVSEIPVLGTGKTDYRALREFSG
jgi:long-chain-fatty-acid--[acyl-carrier-protein] ligase